MPRNPLRLTQLTGLALGALLAGCSDAGRPTGPVGADAPPTADAGGPSTSGLLPGVTNDLVACQPLSEATASLQVGPAGGVLVVGPHRLEIPAGALDRTVTVTAVAPTDTVNSVRFGPEGLRFNPDHRPTLRMSYANCSLTGTLLPKEIVYTTDDLGSILEVLTSVDDLLGQQVSTRLDHFSRYAIAW